MESNVDILNTTQRIAYDKIMADLAGPKRLSILRAGQRSGKTIIEGAVAESFQLVSLFTGDFAKGAAKGRSCVESWLNPPEVLLEVWPGDDRKIQPSKILIVLDEAFWNSISFEQHHAALNLGYSVLVVGSNGPFSNRFAHLPGQSFATWELNPLWPKIAFDGEFAADAVKAQRDYGSF